MANTILPADTYIVVNRTIINETDKRLVTTLYQPIIGNTATSLYFTLIDDLHKREIMSNEETHHHLMATMQLKLENLVIAREKLEAVGLLKTYLKKEDVNNYVYVLYSPMSAQEFLNHPILNVVLYNNIGKKEYDKIINYYKIPKINLKDYEDITANFNSVFSSFRGNIFNENDNIIERNQNSIKLDSHVDFNLIISSIPKSMVNENCFNNETKDLISNLAYIYCIDDLNMQMLVRNSLNEKGMIDKNELRINCRNFYQFESGGSLPTLVYTKQPEYLKTPRGDTSNRAKLIYTFENITPYDYLKSKYKNGEPSLRELKIIEDLMINYKMKPGVVNVLISYVLKVNDQKFTKNYVDTVAAQWSRLNIETVEDAMRVAEKEHNKIKKLLENKTKVKESNSDMKNVSDDKLPSWFNKKLNAKAMSAEEQAEIDNLLKDFS